MLSENANAIYDLQFTCIICEFTFLPKESELDVHIIFLSRGINIVN